MRLGTRLLAVLLPIIGVVMLGYGAWALSQRQATVVSEARRETEAYARALAVAIEYASRTLPPDELREILDEVSRAPSVYGVAVYDAAGRLTLAAGALRELEPLAGAPLQAVLEGAAPERTERVVQDERVYSVLRPLRTADGTVAGALEVAQPLGFVELEMRRVGLRFVMNTLTLLVAVALLTLLVVRRFVSHPMRRFVEATRAVGRGDLRHRLATAGGGELEDLGLEFNRMAEQLEAARADLLREAEERVALERQLRESEKMATVGKLAAGLAHEIAAPLNVISGRAELVLRRDGLEDEQRRSLRIIVDQIRRITTIVRNLLDFGRRREARRARTDLRDVVTGALSFLDTEFAGAGVTVQGPGPERIFVTGDPDHLHQVLVNLLLNAVQAMRDHAGERRIDLRLTRGEAAAVLEVADTGPGIPPDARERIFEPFFSTKVGGTGLGLVVARSIIEEHGGQLEVLETEPKTGAAFRITLPLAAAQEAAGV